jgi:hypothetical protein
MSCRESIVEFTKIRIDRDGATGSRLTTREIGGFGARSNFFLSRFEPFCVRADLLRLGI